MIYIPQILLFYSVPQLHVNAVWPHLLCSQIMLAEIHKHAKSYIRQLLACFICLQFLVKASGRKCIHVGRRQTGFCMNACNYINLTTFFFFKHAIEKKVLILLLVKFKHAHLMKTDQVLQMRTLIQILLRFACLAIDPVQFT